MTEPVLHVPHITLLATALLGLIFTGITIWVITVRGKTKILIGDGNIPALTAAMRAHANFAEFVPLCLLLIGACEMLSGGSRTIQVLAYGLVVARTAHPFGMAMQNVNPLRGAGAVVTLLIMLTASIKLLLTLVAG